MKRGYEDIIGHPHYEPKNHPRMSMSNRAAQFSPFAALTGYEEAVEETARLTDSERILDESKMEELDRLIGELAYSGRKDTSVVITYFVPDEKKEGGRYETAEGVIKKADPVEGVLVMQDGSIIRKKYIRDMIFL